MKFNPHYTIEPRIAQALMKIEAFRQAVDDLPITPQVMAKLRETARLLATHYSTQIEGNRLTQEEVAEVIQHKGHFPGRARDEREVKAYYAGLNYIEHLLAQGQPLTEKVIQTLHALVVADGKTNVTPTPYRTEQNVIKDSSTGAIVYLPPEASDVAQLMKQLVSWIRQSHDIPAPLVAAIAHYQFVTIHPYLDGNGRTARLLTTFILHQRGYGLKGFYALEEYYAQDLASYYDAMTIGPSHNYYLGRESADITPWVLYFCTGMAYSFEHVKKQAENAANRGKRDVMPILRTLDPKQRKMLTLFQDFDTVTTKQVEEFFGFKSRTARALCQAWVEADFLVVVDPSRKARKYQLADAYKKLLSE